MGEHNFLQKIRCQSLPAVNWTIPNTEGRGVHLRPLAANRKADPLVTLYCGRVETSVISSVARHSTYQEAHHVEMKTWPDSPVVPYWSKNVIVGCGRLRRNFWLHFAREILS